jgi:hypothetical protein
MDLLEGGIRVPYIVRWPEKIPANTSTAQCAITMDWVATLLAAAQVNPHADYPLDGINLLPVLAAPDQLIERALYWRMKYRQQRALRQGQWKYFANEDGEFLFDLDADPRERANLAHRQADRLTQLKAQWERWHATLPALPADATVSIPYTRQDLAHP